MTIQDNSYLNPAYKSDEDERNIQYHGDWRNSPNSMTRNATRVVNLDKHFETKDAPMHFDDILPFIGEFGKYQKILFLYMIPFGFYLAFVYFTQIFLTLIPEQYWCAVPELDNLTIAESMQLSIPRLDGEFSKCLMYNVNYTDLLENGVTQANSSWPTAACSNGWSYNFTEIPYATIATDLNWVCEDSAKATYAQSIFFLGAIVGGLLFGWIADRFGRIPSMIACNLVGCAAGVATAFVDTFWSFALMRFFVGFAFDNCFVMMFILVLEYVGPKYRTFVANMSIALFFTCGACVLPWMAYYLADWKLLAIVTSIPLILVIFAPWLIPESARWLVSQGSIEKSVVILKKMAKSNKKEVSEETYRKFRESCLKIQEEDMESHSYSIIDLFRTPRLRRTTILFIVIWMSITLVFDGHVRNVGSLGLDIFITFTIACFTEFPAATMLTYTLDKLGRRWYACGSMVLSGVFSLLATLAPMGIYSASLAIAGRFFVNISYNIGSQYAAEILPTVVRAQGVAFIHIMGYVATIIAPFVVYLSTISTTLPLIVLGILGIIGGVLCLFLPETMDQDLPRTLQDGEEFGLNQTFWDFPCLQKNKNKNKREEQIVSFRRSSINGSEFRSSISRRAVNSQGRMVY